MGYKIEIRNTTYDLKDGFTIKEEFNETLDSGTIQFATYGEEIDKEPFDDAIIFHSESNIITNKHLEVDSITDDIYSFADNLEECDHFYTMSLFSETKSLERITLPSCSVTQPLDNSPKTTVWEVINRFCSEYLPKIKVRSGANDFEYVPCYEISSDVQEKFRNVVCPELQWDNPTLKEVLNDLMSTRDCIVCVKNRVLSFYDLTARGNAIDKTKLSRMTSHFASSDYVSELTMYMKNGIGKNCTKSYRYQVARTTDESGEITTNNMAIITQKPIYSIKSLKLYFMSGDTTSSDTTGNKVRLHCADVADRVLEYDDWRLKSNRTLINYGGTLPHWTDSNGYEAPEHRISYLYYKRGGNSIENLMTIYKGGSLFSETFLTETYVGICNVIRTLNASQKEDFKDSIKNSARNLFYEIEYETLYEQGMHFGKNIPNHHPKNRMFDNQSNAYVDIQHQSIFEYAKVNRLSNQIKEIYGEYETESEVPFLGDYIDDYILFSKEVTYYDNKIMFKGYLTKNYVLKDYYTGVMAKKRSWQIASQSEALSKHEIIKLYVEASFHRKKDKIIYGARIGGQGSYYGGDIICPLTEVKTISGFPFDNYVLNEVKVQTISVGSVMHPTNNFDEALVLDSDIEVLGNSICWTFGFEDNYNGSDYCEKAENIYTQNFYPYANKYGQFEKIYIGIFYKIKDSLVDGDGNSYALPTSWEEGGAGLIDSETWSSITEAFRSRPLCKTGMFDPGEDGFVLTLNHHKDTREIFKATVQFEYCSDTPDIIVKPKFLEYVRAVNKNGGVNIKIYASSTGKYTVNDTTPKGYQAYGQAFLEYSHYANNSTCIFVKQKAMSNPSCWCIANTDGEILLAVNKGSGVYFNLLSDRDTNIYASKTDRTVVGTIVEN